MFGRLHRLAWPVSCAERSARLLDDFDLGGAGKKAVKTYSGGMRRKLDLALSLMKPSRRSLFLDELHHGPGSRQPAMPCGTSSAASWDGGRRYC